METNHCVGLNQRGVEVRFVGQVTDGLAVCQKPAERRLIRLGAAATVI